MDLQPPTFSAFYCTLSLGYSGLQQLSDHSPRCLHFSYRWLRQRSLSIMSKQDRFLQERILHGDNPSCNPRICVCKQIRQEYSLLNGRKYCTRSNLSLIITLTMRHFLRRCKLTVWLDAKFSGSWQLIVHVESYDYWTLVRESSAICQQISTVALFSGIFYHALMGMLSAKFLITIDAVFTAVGFFLHWYTAPSLEGIDWVALRICPYLFTSDWCLAPYRFFCVHIAGSIASIANTVCAVWISEPHFLIAPINTVTIQSGH